MIPYSFDYKKAHTVAEAVHLLNKNPNAKILAGGHSLIPAMKLRLNAAEMLIDISKIHELNFIRDRGKFIAIGAATTHQTIATHKTSGQKTPLLAYAAEKIGDVQVRNKGTIGGSIAHADPAADWPGVLLAAEATVKVVGSSGERKIPAEEFFTGFFSTALHEGEIITEIQVPDTEYTKVRCIYIKFDQPASKFAIVGCAVQMKVSEDGVITKARVAFNGVSDHAYRAKNVEAALEGKFFNDALVAAAAPHAVDGVELIMSDHYADETYRKHLAIVACKRALMACLAQD